MINHTVLLLIGDPTKLSALRAQQAARFLGEFDMALPRTIIPEELDKRFSWAEGSAKRVLAALVDLDILESLSQGRQSAGGSFMFALTAKCGWTPRSLEEQWKRASDAKERERFASLE